MTYFQTTKFESYIFGLKSFLTTGQKQKQPRSQGLSSLPPLVVGTETPVAAGHVTTQNLGGRKICWKGGDKFTKANVLEYPCTHPAVLDG